MHALTFWKFSSKLSMLIVIARLTVATYTVNLFIIPAYFNSRPDTSCTYNNHSNNTRMRKRMSQHHLQLRHFFRMIKPVSTSNQEVLSLSHNSQYPTAVLFTWPSSPTIQTFFPGFDGTVCPIPRTKTNMPLLSIKSDKLRPT